MKRGRPLKRNTPLKRGGELNRGAPLRRTPMKIGPGRRRRDGRLPGTVDPTVALEVRGRSGDICERCRIRPATDMHHRVTRTRGGPGDVFNLAHLCSDCHHVHAHGQLEHPWYVRGRFIGGRYIGPDDAYSTHYNDAGA